LPLLFALMISIHKHAFTVLLMLSLGVSWNGVQAQDILGSTITYNRTSQEKVGNALLEISEEHGFYFSYQNSVVQVEKPVPVTEYMGTLEGFLETLLGDEYEFKELNNYVIIRYAPGILDLDAQVEKNSRQLTVKGFVKDRQTGEAIAYASVYDRSYLNSTLTDDKGYFEFRTKSEESAWLTLSKDRYRDTTFMILPAVEIEASRKKNLFRYFQEDGSADEVEQSFFGRMFIGFQQRFQRINLGGFFAESPFQMSLTPGLSSQGMFNSQMVNKFSLNLLGGYTAGVDGFEAAGVFNINQKDVRYFQMAGAVNVVGGSVSGFQAAGISNKVFKKFKGLQVAGIVNHNKQEVQGLQVAGIMNRVESEAGHQIAGMINYSHVIKGLQIAGIGNWATHEAKGAQVAGIFNKASGTTQQQVSGLVNKAGTVKGIQLAGLVNIAESSDYPVALLNFIENGKKSLALQSDESAMMHIIFRSGGRVLYGVLGAGYKAWGAPVYSLETGLGIYLVEHSKYTMDMELVAQVMSNFKDKNYNTTSLRILNGIQIHSPLRVFVAPTLNFTTLEKDNGFKFRRLELASRMSDQRIWRLDLGVTAGLQYVF